MDRKTAFYLIISAILVVGVLFSCSDIGDDDRTPPTIEVWSPSADTLIYVTRDNDTVFPIFRARFTDDVALSSYTFRIRHGRDSLQVAPGDTSAYFYKNYQSVSIFDTTRTTITQLFRIDSLVKATPTGGTSRTYPIWEGEYQLEASVTDKQGNVAKYRPIPIRIQFRSSKAKAK